MATRSDPRDRSMRPMRTAKIMSSLCFWLTPTVLCGALFLLHKLDAQEQGLGPISSGSYFAGYFILSGLFAVFFLLGWWSCFKLLHDVNSIDLFRFCLFASVCGMICTWPLLLAYFLVSMFDLIPLPVVVVAIMSPIIAGLISRACVNFILPMSYFRVKWWDALCEACGYDLRGSNGITCPECGWTIDQSTRQAIARVQDTDAAR